MNAITRQNAALATAADSDLTITVERLAGNPEIALVRCDGYIDTYNHTQVQRIVGPLIDGGTDKLILEMSKTRYISSAGVGALVELLNRARRSGGNLILAALKPRVLEVIQLLGFNPYFDIVDTVGEALQFLPAAAAVPAIPFDDMEAITGTFGILERIVKKEDRPELYAGIVNILKRIERLKSVSYSWRR